MAVIAVPESQVSNKSRLPGECRKVPLTQVYTVLGEKRMTRPEIDTNTYNISIAIPRTVLLGVVGIAQ